MDALREAHVALQRADDIRNADRWTGDRDAASFYEATVAQAYAGIAQAEQLKRIADALEDMVKMREFDRAYSPIPDLNGGI